MDNPANLPVGAVPQAHGGYLIPVKPGEARNPKGRPSAGATIREHINGMIQGDLSQGDLELVAQDQQLPAARRIAAQRILLAMEYGDQADFDDWLTGAKSLKDLKREGVNTAIVKKAKVKRTVTEFGESVEREIELHSRSGEDVDRIFDRTEGKSIARVEHSGDIGLTVKRVILEFPE